MEAEQDTAKASEIFRITFCNEEYSEKYKCALRKAIEGAMQAESLKVQIEDTGLELLVRKDVQEDDMFLIDVNPKSETLLVPSYKRSTKEIFDGVELPPPVENIRAASAKSLCFNCSSSGHSIRDCPEERNQARIKKAMKSFGIGKTERYHVDVEQRFAHLKPGHLSEQLLRALGCRKNELPHFMYRMRLAGYPPGWLEEAKVRHSGISMFDQPGVHVGESDEEEGEIENEKDKFDVSKIIGFPGFNVSPGDDFIDDYNYHGVPPFDPRDSIDNFVQSFGDNVIKGYKRKKIRVSNAVADTSEVLDDIIEVQDMDIEEGAIPSPPPPASDENLEKEENTEECSTPAKVRKIEQTEVLSTPAKTEKTEVTEEESPLATPAKADTSSNDPIMETMMGTPILKFSPYEKLPAGRSFQEGVSDVINFENLPDSTGKYKTMEKLIKKVRTVISRINNEDD